MSLTKHNIVLSSIALSLLCGVFVITPAFAQSYNGVSFYISAHQDDWQLFMGADAFNDINDFDEKCRTANGQKVVFIYTAAGNLDDSDDTKTCNCRESHDSSQRRIPYWQVREQGAKNSIHLAASRMGGWGPAIPHANDDVVSVNGHTITRYRYKNTVSYFLRIKAGAYGYWYDSSNLSAGTMDGSTTYVDRGDFENTLYAIFSRESDAGLANCRISVHLADTDQVINPDDHHDHLIAARASLSSVSRLSQHLAACIPTSLYVDYNTANLPVNIEDLGGQNEAALTAVYCLALLDYNAWPEWGNLYQKWTSRNYFRKVIVCPDGK